MFGAIDSSKKCNIDSFSLTLDVLQFPALMQRRSYTIFRYKMLTVECLYDMLHFYSLKYDQAHAKVIVISLYKMYIQKSRCSKSIARKNSKSHILMTDQ